MKLYPASRIAIEYALKRYHYAKTIVNPEIAYSVFNDKEEFCGVICYGTGGGPYIGKQFNLSAGRWIELQRVALNGAQEVTSQAVAISLKLLKKDKPCKRLVISYADIGVGHVGTIYKAGNWYYLGIYAKGVKKYFDPVRNKYIHQRGIKKRKMYIIEKTPGKHKYAYPLGKEMIPVLEKLRKDYPASVV